MSILLTAALLAASVLFPPPPGVVIDHDPVPTGLYIGSPSIVILPDGTYVSSHDIFGPKSGQDTRGTTMIFRSTDRGLTWKKTAELKEQFWSNLFLVRGKLYLMGSSYEYGRIVIRRSIDGGLHWTPASFLTAGAGYHTAPVPVVEKDGRLWRAMEFHPAGPWGSFQAFVLSAPVESDLLDSKNWTMTDRLPYPSNETEGKTWLEGNAVIAPNGKIVDVLRVADIEKAAIVQVEGSKMVFDRLVTFPGGAKKFTIRYDKQSHRYWTLSNPALKKYPLSQKDPGSVRNVLALMSSKDLHEWKIQRIVLSHPTPERYGFQYVDWQFEGKDIVFVSRTGWEDGSGAPPRAHDANYFTFHRIVDFRSNISRR